ncbi:hypothetical protein BCR44DRAFT_1423406 [Catenaria anguillulae PL171]|uniref:Secreted protein n=1 Tax=Catenaria anguillulae PL171 TaxID=765915 RepID=A0A1Y2I4D4_9FUNG|nr:hypothetical protein BCR44DRAFT_1423406 [Catenaria anguillulae PL171]
MLLFLFLALTHSPSRPRRRSPAPIRTAKAQPSTPPVFPASPTCRFWATDEDERCSSPWTKPPPMPFV